MAEISPQTDIIVMAGLPFPVDYDYTIHFESLSAQYRFILGSAVYVDGNRYFTRYKLTRQMYQRQERGWMKIQIKYQTARTLNYLAFRNGEGLNWVFAFITNSEYVNENTTLIQYQIDIMQTYMFSYTLNPCIVEREHVADDSLFKHYLPEDIEVDDYEINGIDLSFGHLGDTNQGVLVGATFDKTHDRFMGGWYNGVYQGASLQFFKTGSEIVDFLLYATDPATGDKSEGIIGMYMIPSFFGDQLTGSDANFYYTPVVSDALNAENLATSWVNKHHYRNNKLCCYPYCYLSILQNNGDEQIFDIRLFQPSGNEITTEDIGDDYTPISRRNVKFFTRFCAGLPPMAELYPEYYDGNRYNRRKRLVVGDFPVVSWNIDSYKAWLANNIGQQAIGITSDVLGGILGITGSLTGGWQQEKIGKSLLPTGESYTKVTPAHMSGSGILGAVSSGVHMGINLAYRYDSFRMAKNLPNKYFGGNANMIDAANGYLGWKPYFHHLTKSFAKRVDEFFDRYGYRVMELKTPSLVNRTAFTYVKTNGCSLTANSCNAETANQIKAIFDNGITFFTLEYGLSYHLVGNYAVENRPLDNVDLNGAELLGYDTDVLEITPNKAVNGQQDTEVIYTQLFDDVQVEGYVI